MDDIVRVGVGVFLIREGKVLIGKRKNAHGEGKYGFPGGHLEFGETIEECAIRELKEETSIDAKLKDVHTLWFTDDFMESDNKHYLTIYPKITTFSGKVSIEEPHKIEKWEWMNWEEVLSLGKNLFIPIQNFIKKYPDFDPTK